MIYVIEYNYPSKMLVEHINNYLEKKRVRNLPASWSIMEISPILTMT